MKFVTDSKEKYSFWMGIYIAESTTRLESTYGGVFSYQKPKVPK